MRKCLKTVGDIWKKAKIGKGNGENRKTSDFSCKKGLPKSNQDEGT